MANKYVVIGLGQFGNAIAVKLASKGVQVIALDNDERHIEAIKDDVSHAVRLDATNKKALIAQNVSDATAVVVAIGKNFEALLLCSAYLLEMGVKRLMVRANGPQQRMILKKMGITEILSPEGEVGQVVAERLLNPNILSFLELPDGYEVVEIKPPMGIVNKTIGEISLRNKYSLNLITIKREFDESENGVIVKAQHVLGVPKSETVIYETDTIVIFGKDGDIQKFIELN